MVRQVKPSYLTETVCASKTQMNGNLIMLDTQRYE